MNPSDLNNRRVTVMGLGRFGGGVGTVRFLLQQGARVTLTDLQSADHLAVSLSQLDIPYLDQLVLGEHREEDFRNADLVVINPGIVAEKNRYLRIATEANVPITTEINLFWERCRARKIVVTGTVGKSTTTTLIQHLLQSAGVSCRLGGNIGISLLPEVETFSADDWVVLELSSFQLSYLKPQQPRPEICVITNFLPNHLDWHGNIKEYQAAKQVALNWQGSSDVAVLNADDPEVMNWETHGRTIYFGTDPPSGKEHVQLTRNQWYIRVQDQQVEIPVQDLPIHLHHPHQLMNISAALAAVSACIDCSVEQISPGLRTHQSLPHRLEYITEHNGVRYINDSKATTAEATQAAFAAISTPIVLIAGGKDKRVDISGFCRMISENVKAVALIGDTALLMALLLPEYRMKLRYSVHNDLASAMRWAVKQAESGDTVLLSPGCSSDSMFLNYEDRGNQFRQLVVELCTTTPY